MISIIKTPRVIRSFLVYDLEWIPGTMELRVFGVYDGERYRWYKTVEGFLQKEFTHKNRGKWFYAHAGGLADIAFVFQELSRNLHDGKFSLTAAFSGSSAIIVNVRMGKNSFHLMDSYWLLRDKLASIAKSLGVKKGSIVDSNFDKLSQNEKIEFYRSAPISELVSYNEQDCKILWDAIHRFQLEVLDLGGQLQPTIASTAMRLFRTKYLKNDIPTSQAVNETARNSYYASRVEIFKTYCKDVKQYDINSSFPYSMTFPCPGKLSRSSMNIPGSEELYIADCEIDNGDSYLPLLPTRIKNRLFFPNGSWRGWYTSVDLQLLEEMGGKINKVHEVLIFERMYGLSDYANDLFDIRKNCKDPFKRIVYKYLLNSLYGKFGEGRFKQGLYIDPSWDVLNKLRPWHERSEKQPGAWYGNMLNPGIWLIEREIPVPHEHVPISSFITSNSRSLLYRYMKNCENVYYVDTDSIVTESELPVGNELGQLKLEDEIVEAQFFSPKMYKKSLKDGGIRLKAKGFSLGHTEDDGTPHVETLERFNKIVSMQNVPIRRMRRVREMFRRGDIRPQEIILEKGLSQHPITKRFFYTDGSSRPWNIDELKKLIK